MLTDFHLILDSAGRPIQAYGARPGEVQTEISLTDIPIPDLAAFATKAASSQWDEFHHDEGHIRFRIKRHKTSQGNVLAMASTIGRPPPLDQLLNPLNAGKLRQAVHNGGMILVFGDSESGKTTLASSLFLDTVEKESCIGYAWQDPPEYQLEGPAGDGYALQIPITSATYSTAAIDAKRVRAGVHLFSEIRAPESAVALMDLASMGTPVIGTSHGFNNLIGIISFLARAKRIDRNAADSLAAVLSCVVHCDLFNSAGTISLKTAIMPFSADISAPERVIVRGERIEQLNTLFSQKELKGA